MIEYIELENFRSILHDSIEFDHITVLIGANGSGKSNLVKALEFLSELPRSGIAVAVNSQGGANGIIPKVFSRSRVPKAIVSIKYRARMPAPPKYPTKYKSKLLVDHSIKFRFPPGQVLYVEEEELTFHQVLSIAMCLWDNKAFKNLGTDDASHPSHDSTFSIIRPRKGDPIFKEDPPVNADTLPVYVRALGLPFLEKQVKSREDLIKRVSGMWEHRRKSGSHYRGMRRYQYSFLDPDITTILGFSPQFMTFHSDQSDIRRYDLLLNELRVEQAPSKSRQLTRTGENMPTVLREMSSDPNRRRSWKRLQNTFSSLAPHIFGMRPASLRTGKEFVEFVESKTGRGVESWESSDGSLRALAILLAIETAMEGDTILIEEPEQNLHPWAVRDLMDHLREAAKERELQVVMTTHSQHVLERVKPEEVRVAIRTIAEGTKFHKIKDLLPHSDIHMGEVGEMWVKGLLSGVPTYADDDR